MYVDIMGMTREEIISEIKNNGFFIENVDDPDEELQLLAVDENYFSIRCIHNPTEAAQLAAIENGAWLVKFIAKPCQKVLEIVGDRFPIPKNISPDDFKYKFYEPVFTTMEDIMFDFNCYINEKVKFFKYKTLEAAMNYLFKNGKDKWRFENASRACMIDIRRLDFNNIKQHPYGITSYFDDVLHRTEFNHGEEVDGYYLLPCLFGADDCPDGHADYLVFEYESDLYLITILCYE